MHTSLKDKTTLVSGVSSGIGREIAQLTVRNPKAGSIEEATKANSGSTFLPGLPMRPPLGSDCPLAYALNLFGDRWTLLVIRDLFQGKQRFDEFISSPEGIATNILTHRLKRLTEHGLVKRIADEQDQRRFLYRLTPLGKSTQQFLRPMIRWSSAHSRSLAKPQTTED